MTAPPAFDRYVAFDHCRHPLPFFSWHNRDHAAAQLHRLALELSRPGTLAAPRRTRATASVLYLVSGLRQALRSLRQNARAARRLHRVSYRRQVAGVLHTVFRRNASPDSYYIHRLFRPTDLRRLELFFEHRELMLLLRALYTNLETEQISHKVRFGEFCRRHSLATPPEWAVFSNGQVDTARSTRWLADPRADVFVKPSADYAGHGVARWRYDPATQTYSDGAHQLTHRELTERLVRASATGVEHLIQPRLHEAPPLADLAGGAVCNFRVLTGCAPSGEPKILTTSLRLPPPGHYLTDVGNDIFAAPVDIRTGQLAHAQAKAIARGVHVRHPETGGRIEGRLVANWSEIAALAIRAHAACRWMPFVGWDIVNSTAGPVLLEANTYWGGNLCQMSGHRFLGETAFLEIYLAQLQHLRPDLATLLER